MSAPKILNTLLLFYLFMAPARAQDSPEQIRKSRAKEFHRMMGLEDGNQWATFVRENYTEVLINRSLKQKINESENGQTTTSTAEVKGEDKIRGKAKMFERLHDDFGHSEIISTTATGDVIEMVVRSESGLEGIFRFTFEKEKPYRIDALGIRVTGGQ